MSFPDSMHPHSRTNTGDGGSGEQSTLPKPEGKRGEPQCRPERDGDDVTLISGSIMA